jgi:probable HAF family extracellular repeat protein
MRRKHLLAGVLVAAGLAGTVWAVLWLRQPPLRYEKTILTTPAGEPLLPVALNERGQVLGLVEARYSPASSYRFFYWTRAQGAQELDYPAQSGQGAPELNNAGVIAGVTKDPNGAWQGFLWEPDGGIRWRRALGGSWSVLTAVNDRGQCVGFAEAAARAVHAVLWNVDGTAADLGTLGGAGSMACSLNDRGQVAGFSQAADGAWHAFFWDPNIGTTDLGPTSLTSPSPWDIRINNSGHVLGRFGSPTDPTLISLWHPAKGRTPLPSLEGSDVHVTAFNDANQALLQVRAAGFKLFGRALSERQEAYVYDPQRGLMSVGRYIGRGAPQGFYPRDINNRGQIVGIWASRSTARAQGLLLDPIPSPPDTRD